MGTTRLIALARMYSTPTVPHSDVTAVVTLVTAGVDVSDSDDDVAFSLDNHPVVVPPPPRSWVNVVVTGSPLPLVGGHGRDSRRPGNEKP